MRLHECLTFTDADPASADVKLASTDLDPASTDVELEESCIDLFLDEERLVLVLDGIAITL